MADAVEKYAPGSDAGRFLIMGLEAESPEEIPQAVDFIEEISPFGIILFTRNVPDLGATLAWTETLRARLPELVISIDHEGGRVHRLPEPFTRFPPALALARNGDPGLVRDVARAQARELRAAGFDLSYAPVLDVHTNPDNPVIGDRSFGETPEEVIHNALPYLQGLAEAGILGCGKHFPGHGDTSLDSHLALPTVDCDAERLFDLEIRPFARAIDQGLPMIMTAHVVFRALDPQRPASLSRLVIDGILRQRLGFRGVVVSDDLEMKAVCRAAGASCKDAGGRVGETAPHTDAGGRVGETAPHSEVSGRVGETAPHTDAGATPADGPEAESASIAAAAVAALAAGSDLVMVCRYARNVRAAKRAIAESIACGRLSPAALDSSDRRRQKLLRRIKRLRRSEFGVSVIGAAEHRDLAARLS